jgi:dCTP deaminase
MTTLSDSDIHAEMIAGRLIRAGDTARLAGACYELRMGEVYYDLTEDGKRFALKPGQNVLIKPGHRVVLITAEELDIPADILVRVVSKGSLFSIGLSAVATYADPGFSGNLGIVTENVSDKYIELPQGEPIAKADFTRISAAASKPYKGQHGFQAGIWPIKAHLQKSYADVAHDPRVKSELEEALALLPAATRSVIREIETRQIWTDAGLLVAIMLNAAALVAMSTTQTDFLFGVVGNLVASSIVGFMTVLVRYVRRT